MHNEIIVPTLETAKPDSLGDRRNAPVRQCGQPIRAAFVTNICPHYRVKTFEILAQRYETDFLFYSAGNEWYWQKDHGVRKGNFRHCYLPVFHLTRRLRISPSLITMLLREPYDVYIKCINGRFALPVTYLVARLRRKPFVLWTGIWMTLGTPFHRLIFPLTRWIYRHADAIVVYGEHVRRYLVSVGVRPEKIFVACHAVDNSAYNGQASEHEKTALRRKLEIDKQKMVLYLGRLEAIKGLDYLVRAFAALTRGDVTLVIAGDGALRKELEVLADQLGIHSRIRFVGYVPADEARAYYALADLLVLPSVVMPTGKETWGLVVNEAMNQGVPVIATDAVGAAAGGLVQSGVNGFIVPERDSEALAQAIDRILSDDKLREQMSANARRIIAGWDNERMVKGFQQAIQYAIGHSRP
jgi:glycosyltransferase involved in cell wall biosynthesis